MRVHQTVKVPAIGVALVALSASLAGQTVRPDGQPEVQGAWRPVIGGTHSLDPAKSGAADFEERIGGVVRNNPSRIVDPPDGHIPYQPWAAALQKGLEAVYETPTRPEHIDTQTRCLVPGVPRLYYFPTFRILQPPGSVVFVWDEYHAFRVVPLDGRPHVGGNIKLWMGDGRGRWEGNTLVVDTASLKAKSRLDVVGDFFSDEAHIVERFIFADINTMTYEATITDPHVFTRPWTIRVAHRRMPDEEFWEWACHEGERDAANSSSRIDSDTERK
ncbi:MAG: hypothetical protein HYY76_15835 [Acidobacteria bacterium]|nr:hypothetical protein [Acidobacteriota bacterium]